MCSHCGENEARYRLTLTNARTAEVVAADSFCAECIVVAGVVGRGAALDVGVQ